MAYWVSIVVGEGRQRHHGEVVLGKGWGDSVGEVATSPFLYQWQIQTMEQDGLLIFVGICTLGLVGLVGVA